MSGTLSTITDIVSLLQTGAWMQRLRRASFRGAPFYVDTASGQYGRRYAMHQYPGRDTPYAEDLGRKQRAWTFQGYCIGGAYLSDRSAVIKACEKAGPARLVHPLLGSFQAVCTDVTFSDRRDVGGFSTLDLSFAEAGELAEPDGAEDSVTGLEIGSAALGLASQAGFLKGFDVSGPFAFAAPLAVAGVTGLADRLDFLRLPSFGLDQGPLSTALDTLRDTASTLVNDPGALFDQLSTTFEQWTGCTDAVAGIRGMFDIALHDPLAALGIGDATTPETLTLRALATSSSGSPVMTPARATISTSAQALRAVEQQLALREIGYLLPGVDLDSVDAALRMRGSLSEAFDEASQAAAEAGDDDTYEALTGLLMRALRALDAEIAQLPALQPYTTVRSLNALLLAWQLYQDANRDLDIVARTDAISPAFMPLTGQVLER